MPKTGGISAGYDASDRQLGLRQISDEGVAILRTKLGYRET